MLSIAFSADDADWTGTFVDPDNLVDPDPEPIDEEACDGTGVIIVPHDQRNGANNIATILSTITDTETSNNAPVITNAANLVSIPHAPANNNNSASNNNNNNLGKGKGN